MQAPSIQTYEHTEYEQYRNSYPALADYLECVPDSMISHITVNTQESLQGEDFAKAIGLFLLHFWPCDKSLVVNLK